MIYSDGLYLPDHLVRTQRRRFGEYELKYGAAGHLMWGTGGHLSEACAPVITPGTPCSLCSATTPRAWLATVSGANDPGCRNSTPGPGGSSFNGFYSALNRTQRLTQNLINPTTGLSGACSWSFVGSGITALSYSGKDCVTLAATGTTERWDLYNVGTSMFFSVGETSVGGTYTTTVTPFNCTGPITLGPISFPTVYPFNPIMVTLVPAS